VNGALAFTVIARSEATKQSTLSSATSMDCFASLAMTISKAKRRFNPTPSRAK
jgi:hypothetical protein